MSDNFPLIKECVKLEGISNYPQWIDEFRALCHSYDKCYWYLYTGVYKPVINAKIELAHEECRIRCAEALNSTPETVTDKEIADWTKKNVTYPNVNFTGWMFNQCHVLSLIKRTIDKSVAALIHDGMLVYKISACFASAFGRITRDSWLTKMSNLTNWRFKPPMSAQLYVRNFKRYLTEVYVYRPNEISPALAWSFFVNGARYHGRDVREWVELQNPDFESNQIHMNAMDSLVTYCENNGY